MSSINPVAVVRVISQNVKQKYGENQADPTQDDLLFADIIFKMIVQRHGGDSNQTKSTSNSSSMKPVSTTAVPGTPWCVVWTDKNRVFYFNPSTKKSVWDRPPELRNREDVDKMVSNPVNPNTTNTTNDVNRQSSASESSPGQGDKLKSENGTATTQPSSYQREPSASNPAKMIKKDVNTDIEKDAARKRETIPYQERVDTFRAMLEEKKVNPSSTFRNELSKIVFDPRYLLLTSNERRETFERYCQEKLGRSPYRSGRDDMGHYKRSRA